MQQQMRQTGIEPSGMTAEEAITGRKCYRAFLPDPVPVELIERVLAIAGRAPSGSNIQPWNVHVLLGEAKDTLGRELLEAHMSSAEHTEEYQYYPTAWREPYISRRRKIGWDMYGLLGITRADKDKMAAQLGRNYIFFDAPVGLIFTIDRDLEMGSWLDYGMFLQNIMIAARAFGLETCPQQAFAKFHSIIQKRLAVPDEQMIVCGMSLGYADYGATVNQLTTERMPVSEFTTFVERLEAD